MKNNYDQDILVLKSYHNINDYCNKQRPEHPWMQDLPPLLLVDSCGFEVEHDPGMYVTGNTSSQLIEEAAYALCISAREAVVNAGFRITDEFYEKYQEFVDAQVDIPYRQTIDHAIQLLEKMMKDTICA